MRISRNYFQPDALGRVYQQVTKFSRYRRADQNMERYLLAFDVPRRKAGARVVTGRALPEGSESILRV